MIEEVVPQQSISIGQGVSLPQPPIDHIVIDVEIQNPIESLPGGWNDTHLMGIACAVVYEYRGNKFKVYGPDETTELRERIMVADKITGFNIWKFDYQVIFGEPSHNRIENLRHKTNDLLVRIWRSLGLRTDVFTGAHKGWSLENVATATLGRGKIANGAQAPLWYQEGKIQKVIDYCLDDVSLERDLCNHIETFGWVMHPTKGMLQINKELTTP